MTDITPDLLRQLAEDMEQRPDEYCWEFFELNTWYQAKPAQALSEGAGTLPIRRKPRMIRVTHEYQDGTVKTFKYPEPCRKPLDYDQIYWTASLTGTCNERVWCGTDANNRHLLLGLVHITKEAAEAHRRAMVGEEGDD